MKNLKILIFGLMMLVTIFSGCTKKTPVGQATTTSITNPSTPQSSITAQIAAINSITSDIADLSTSANGLDENEDLSNTYGGS